MKRYAFIDAEGNPIYSATPAIDDAYVDGQMYGEHLCKELPQEYFDDLTVLARSYYKDGWKIRDTRPGSYFNWDNSIEQWVPNLELARIARTSLLKIAYLAADQNGFTYASELISTDLQARSRIDAVNGYVAIFNQLPPDWSGEWIATDGNLVSILNVNAWKQLYKAMTLQILANFSKFEQLKAQIAAATTIGEIEAVSWDL